MSGYRMFQHVYPSFEVYPRVHYFHKRFKDLHARFKRVTSALPESFKERNVETELEQIKSDFDRGLQVKVIGKEDIDDKNLVISASKETKQKEEESPELQERDDPKVNVVVCNIGGFENFREQTLEDLGIDLAQKGSYAKEDILIGPEDLQKRISDKLEEKVADGFSKIRLSLQRFESDDNVCGEVTGKVIESEEIVKTIRDFLQNLSGLKDLNDQTKGVKETFIDCLLQHLCHIIKCAAVSPLARKYNQQIWVCNRLLHEIKFEETLAGSVAKNTRYHLGKMENTVTSSSHDKKKFLFIHYLLQTDMEATFEETEEKFDGMQRLSSIMKRMLFETDGYLKQTNLGLVAVVKEGLHSPNLSIDLRKALLSINAVYGLGTIYGKLEVHLDESRFEDSAEMTDVKSKKPGKLLYTDTDKHGNDKGRHKPNANTEDEEEREEEKQTPLQRVKNKIAEQLKVHRFYHPYSVKFVDKKPEVMNASFEPGKALHSPTGKEGEYIFGTIGGYVESTQRKLYGLTCGHVIGTDGKVYTDEGKERFGNYRKGIEDNNPPFIDIAAVEVHASLQEKYKKYLEQAMTRVTKIMVSLDETNDLIGRYVYKFGASTGVTEGTISAADYNIFALEAHDYLIVIDPLAAEKDLDELSVVFTALQGPLPRYSVHTDAQSSSSADPSQSIAQSSNARAEMHSQLCDNATKEVIQAANSGSQDVTQSLIFDQEAVESQRATATVSSHSESWTDKRPSNKLSIRSSDTDCQPVRTILETENLSFVRSPNTECQPAVRSPNTECPSTLWSLYTECQSVENTPDNQTSILSQNNECWSAVRFQDKECQSVPRSPHNECESTARSPSSGCHSAIQSNNTEPQSAALSPDNESQSAARSPDNEFQSAIRSPDNECQSTTWSPSTDCHSAVQSNNTEPQSCVRTSDNECQSVLRSSDTQSKFVVQSPDTAYQFIALSPDTEYQSDTTALTTKSQALSECSNIESQQTIVHRACEKASLTFSTARQKIVEPSVNIRQTVTKSSTNTIQKIFQPNISVSQTTTRQLYTTGENILKSVQIKSKPISQLSNSTSPTCSKPIDPIKQTDVCASFKRNEEITREDKNINSFGLATLDGEMKEKGVVRTVEPKAKETKKSFRCPVSKLVMSSDSEESSEQGHIGNRQNTLVYVRDIHGVTESDECRPNDLKGVFSSSGDSGAIICTPDPASDGLTCLAVSMLTAGDFKVRGHHGLKSLSFKLSEGLSTISRNCDLTFL